VGIPSRSESSTLLAIGPLTGAEALHANDRWDDQDRFAVVSS
jgi:hypothetical protein